MQSAAIERPASEVQDFDSVVQVYWPRIFRFAMASIRDRDAAETVTQDCFLRAFKGREAFRGDCSVSTWLMQIAVNLVRDFGRSRRLQFWKRTQTAKVDLETIGNWIPDRGILPEARALVMEQVAAVWAAAEILSERQRTVFLLRFVEDMEILEIAAATGMKEGTVKTHLFRALQSVRDRIGSAK